jgi:predicted dehydrogenase
MTDMTLSECKTAMGGDAYQKEVDHFVECIKDRTLVCQAPAEDGVTLMKILCAIYESAASGHEVVID